MYGILSSTWDIYIIPLPARIRDQHEKAFKRLEKQEIVDICGETVFAEPGSRL